MTPDLNDQFWAFWQGFLPVDIGPVIALGIVILITVRFMKKL